MSNSSDYWDNPNKGFWAKYGVKFIFTLILSIVTFLIVKQLSSTKSSLEKLMDKCQSIEITIDHNNLDEKILNQLKFSAVGVTCHLKKRGNPIIIEIPTKSFETNPLYLIGYAGGEPIEKHIGLNLSKVHNCKISLSETDGLEEFFYQLRAQYKQDSQSADTLNIQEDDTSIDETHDSRNMIQPTRILLNNQYLKSVDIRKSSSRENVRFKSGSTVNCTYYTNLPEELTEALEGQVHDRIKTIEDNLLYIGSKSKSKVFFIVKNGQWDKHDEIFIEYVD